MVDRARAVEDGLLTCDVHDVLWVLDFYGPDSFCRWEDLNLDVMGISAWTREGNQRSVPGRSGAKRPNNWELAPV